ncbi:hypothetical protein C8J57DRAFT_1256784 [Mycena rebaudengoi]|nr:hypothetical protein C8J57DRAFT_1256784 [Mycena rebaudengoi]
MGRLTANLDHLTGGPPDEGILSCEECRAATPVAEIKREVTPPPQVQLSELDIWKGRARQSAMAIARLLGDLAVAQDGARADREKAEKWEAKAESATRALQDIQARLEDVQEQLEFELFGRELWWVTIWKISIGRLHRGKKRVETPVRHLWVVCVNVGLWGIAGGNKIEVMV